MFIRLATGHSDGDGDGDNDDDVAKLQLPLPGVSTMYSSVVKSSGISVGTNNVFGDDRVVSGSDVALGVDVFGVDV